MVLVIIEDEPEVARVSIEELSGTGAVDEFEWTGAVVEKAGSNSSATEQDRAVS